MLALLNAINVLYSRNRAYILTSFQKYVASVVKQGAGNNSLNLTELFIIGPLSCNQKHACMQFVFQKDTLLRLS